VLTVVSATELLNSTVLPATLLAILIVSAAAVFET
jgi:hypothetical protein